VKNGYTLQAESKSTHYGENATNQQGGLWVGLELLFVRLAGDLRVVAPIVVFVVVVCNANQKIRFIFFETKH